MITYVPALVGDGFLVVAVFPNLGARLVWRGNSFQYERGTQFRLFRLNETPSLDEKCVRRVFLKIAFIDSEVYQCVDVGAVYKAGFTMVCNCKTADQLLDGLASDLQCLM